jgi:TonB family protein
VGLIIDQPIPVPPADVKESIAGVSLKLKEVSADEQQKMPPPPPPVMKPLNPFESMSTYVSKHTRYPAVALENNITGSIVVQFDINNDHKIVNAVVKKGIGNGCDQEVMRAIHTFPGMVDTNPGTYKFAVTYYIGRQEPPKTVSMDLFKSDPSFVGEVIITGYRSK